MPGVQAWASTSSVLLVMVTACLLVLVATVSRGRRQINDPLTRFLFRSLRMPLPDQGERAPPSPPSPSTHADDSSAPEEEDTYEAPAACATLTPARALRPRASTPPPLRPPFRVLSKREIPYPLRTSPGLRIPKDHEKEMQSRASPSSDSGLNRSGSSGAIDVIPPSRSSTPILRSPSLQTLHERSSADTSSVDTLILASSSEKSEDSRRGTPPPEAPPAPSPVRPGAGTPPAPSTPSPSQSRRMSGSRLFLNREVPPPASLPSTKEPEPVTPSSYALRSQTANSKNQGKKGK